MTAVRLIHSAKQIDKCGFTGTGGSHYRYGLARLDLKTYIVEHLTVAVGKRNMIEFYPSLKALFGIDAVVTVVYYGAAVEYLHHLVG